MNAILVAGLGFGDEGKGATVDALVRSTGAKLVVRYNGGAQAAHHVVGPTGFSHCFAQFGAGTLAGAATFLSRFVAIEPMALMNEAQHLLDAEIDAFGLLTIDPDAPVITPFHKAMNQLREIWRGDSPHGSCGIGVGECFADVAYGHATIRARDLLDQKTLFEKLCDIQARKLSEADAAASGSASRHAHSWGVLHDYLLPIRIAETFSAIGERLKIAPCPAAETVIFEGAQGVLLDEWFGFHPYTTWSTTTFANADALLAEWPEPVTVQRIGVLRAYSTRHGAGPFPTETRLGEHDAAWFDGEHNTVNDWQGRFRSGHLDLTLLRYAKSLVGHLDGLSITSLDRAAAAGREASVSHGYIRHPFSALAASGHVGLDCYLRLPDVVRAFHVPPDHDLWRQQALADALFRAHPVYSPVAVNDLPIIIEDTLETPALLLGHGPKASQRTGLLAAV